MRAWIVFTAVVFYLLLVFGVRTQQHYRATGSTGFRGLSGRPGSLAWFGGVSFAAAVVLVVAGPLLAGLGAARLWWAPTPVTNVAGALGGALGLAGTWWSQAAMGSAWRIGVRETERTSLVMSGPFQWVRNPIFTSMLLAAVGIALVLPTAASWVGALALFVATEIQVRVVEEPYLRRVHADAYAEYCRRVGRLVPGVGRAHG